MNTEINGRVTKKEGDDFPFIKDRICGSKKAKCRLNEMNAAVLSLHSFADHCASLLLYLLCRSPRH